MAVSIRKSERTVKTITSALVDKGIIIRRNGRRNGWWEINNPDESIKKEERSPYT